MPLFIRKTKQQKSGKKKYNCKKEAKIGIFKRQASQAELALWLLFFAYFTSACLNYWDWVSLRRNGAERA